MVVDTYGHGNEAVVDWRKMPKKNVNKNKNDPRAARSMRDIKNATLTLIAQKPFRQIQAEEIIELATVNFKTFYRYYSSKADVLEDIRNDILKDLAAGLESLGPGNLMGGGSSILQLHKYEGVCI